MTPEIVSRVNTWISSNIAWVDEDVHRQCLVLVWKNLTNEASVSSYPYSYALRKAAAGILLALICEAWGDSWDVHIEGGWITVWRSIYNPNPDRPNIDRKFNQENSLEGNLAAALEASPSKASK